MRIIAGNNKGRIIEAPKGQNTRPTTDRVRESIMSSIRSELGSFDDLSILDAFAGSGAFGLEALSQGASNATFCDIDKNALMTIKKNIKTLGEQQSTKVLKHDSLKLGLLSSHINNPYNLVFLDPPYATSTENLISVLKDAFASSTIDENTLIVYEHDENANSYLDNAIANKDIDRIKQKRYGETFVDYLNIAK